MNEVSVSIESIVVAYWISIFNEEGYMFRGEANEDFVGELESGNYTLLYHVIAPPFTEFEILLLGVEEPPSPLQRRVPGKGYTAATRSMRI